MGWSVALIALQFFITMLFYPLRVGAKGHISLAHDKIDVDLTIMKVPVVRLRVKKDDCKFVLHVNGKEPKKNGNMSVTRIANTLKQYKLEGIKANGNMLALISGKDARDTAIAYALIIGILQPIVERLRIFTAQPSDTLEIDGSVKMKINVIQIVGLIGAAMRG